ncbi:MAG: hypothetical protein NTV63_04195 [Candidatus Woesearchaeota archaeon]|nr:hypothetical protein [Candidatus Woesearchaeota archaeon]
MTQPINDEYIHQRYGRDLPQENVDSLKRAMAKYGDNRWWESEDPVTIAKYQVFERILMSDFSIFSEGLEKLLERPVYTHELGRNNIKCVQAEASEAIARLDSKAPPLDKGIAEERELKGIQALFDYAKKSGKAIISTIPQDKYERTPVFKIEEPNFKVENDGN